jgi:hypothetical protein
VASTTTLLVHGTDAGTVVIGALSAIGLTTILASLTVLLALRFHAVCVAIPDDDDVEGGAAASAELSRSSWKQRVLDAINYLFSDHLEWQDAEPEQRFTARFGKVFEPCRGGMHGFMLYELLNCAATGLLGGILPSTSDGCYAVLVLLCIQAAVYVAALAVCRPYRARADLGLALFAGACCLAVAIAMLMDDIDRGVLTATVLMYGSLFSVAAFALHVAVLARLHQRLPYLLRAFARIAAAREKKQRHSAGAEALLPVVRVQRRTDAAHGPGHAHAATPAAAGSDEGREGAAALPHRGQPCRRDAAVDASWADTAAYARRLAAGQQHHSRAMLHQIEALSIAKHPRHERLRHLIEAVVWEQRSRADAAAVGVRAPGESFYSELLQRRR